MSISAPPIRRLRNSTFRTKKSGTLLHTIDHLVGDKSPVLQNKRWLISADLPLFPNRTCLRTESKPRLNVLYAIPFMMRAAIVRLVVLTNNSGVPLWPYNGLMLDMNSWLFWYGTLFSYVHIYCWSCRWRWENQWPADEDGYLRDKSNVRKRCLCGFPCICFVYFGSLQFSILSLQFLAAGSYLETARAANGQNETRILLQCQGQQSTLEQEVSICG